MVRRYCSLLLVAAAGLLLTAGFAFGYTFPDAWVYDGLITYDHGGMPIVPEALHFNVGAGYWTATEFYNEDGDVEDSSFDTSVIAVPIDIGYAINDRILVDVTLQILSIDMTPDPGVSTYPDTSAMGLGDVWIKGRYIAPLGNDLYMGGRLGVKIPVGKVEYDMTQWEPPLGDDQMDIDVALVAAKYPGAGFAMNGQVGFRYRMDATVEEMGNEYSYTPGTLIYVDVAPGYSMGPTNFQVYVPIGYEMTTASKFEGTENEDSETSGLYAGVAPKYGIDANNTVGFKFLYPLMGKNVSKSMMFGVTYEGYLPL
ncbi:MAG: transporter [Candidatus Zixiibacteriota bacterium]|jgi:hypothetical protein